MTSHGSLKNIEKLESDLWEAADNLRANSKLTSSEYFLWPPKPLREEFNEFAFLSCEQSRILALQNQKLRTARDLLLPKLMSGDIEV